MKNSRKMMKQTYGELLFQICRPAGGLIVAASHVRFSATISSGAKAAHSDALSVYQHN